MNWLTVELVLRVAERIFAGEWNMRDRGLLESALARAQNAHVYLGTSIFETAAYYAVGIGKNHPFVDGNKRIAWVSASVFLEGNGYPIQVSHTAETADVIVAAMDGSCSIDHLAGFFRGSFVRG